MKSYCARILILALSWLNFSAFAAASLAPPNTTTVPINRVVAVVNETIITEHDLDREIRDAKSQYLQHHMPIPSDKELRAKILDAIIAKRLMFQIAKQNHIQATEKEIDGMIEGIAEQSHLSLAELKQRLASEHMDYTLFRKRIGEQVLLTKIQQQAVSGRIDITPEKIEKFKQKLAEEQSVTEYHVVDYLIPLNETASGKEKEAGLALAKKTAELLRQGKKPSDEVTVNDLGWGGLESIPDLFVTLVAKMHKGEISAPLLASNGYHVLKLLDTRQTGRTVSDEQARELLFQEQYQTVLKAWVDSLRENSYVKVY